MKNVGVFATLWLLLSFNSAFSYETDQYSTHLMELKDATHVLDDIVNTGIKRVARNWKGSPDNHKFIKHLISMFNARQMEYWIKDNPVIETVNNKGDSVYKTVAWYNSAIIRFKGLASTFSLNDVHVGGDKLSHFFGVGYIYYKESEIDNADLPEVEREAEAIRHGAWTERAYWGELTTNVYSNADLVVNYEGMRFLKSLFRDDIVEGKKAIVKWVGNRPVVQRKFSFRDHVNDFWSEAYLPNWYQLSLRNKVRDVLTLYCTKEEVSKNLNKFVSPHEEELLERYSHLKFNMKAFRFRLDRICNDFYSWSQEEKDSFVKKQTKLEKKWRKKYLASLEETSEEEQDLYEEVSTFIPTCNSNIKKAIFEHKKIIEWEDKTSHILHGLTYDLIEKYLSGNSVSPEEFLSFKNAFFNKLYKRGISLGGKKLYRFLFEKEGVVSLGTDQSSRVKSRLILKNEGEVQVCLKNYVPLESYGKLTRDEFAVSLISCFNKGQESERVESRSYYEIYKDDLPLYTIENFYGRGNLEGYVYRTIPYLCKWY